MFFKVNNINVADAGNKLIKIFSPDGKFVMKIGEQGSFTSPIHCVQCDRYLIVSENGEHCITVFNYDGNFQYNFGKRRGGDGEFHNPCCLSVNKSGHLRVCNIWVMIEYQYFNLMESLLASLEQRAVI